METTTTPIAFSYAEENTDHVPMKYWGKDHWTALALVEHDLFNVGKFKVLWDPRLRMGRHHHALVVDPEEMEDERGRRLNSWGPNYADSWGPNYADLSKFPTRLNDGRVVPDHDDWDCLEDALVEGLLQALDMSDNPIPQSVVSQYGIWPFNKLRWTEKGHLVVAQLRKHKTEGGNFKHFKYQEEPA